MRQKILLVLLGIIIGLAAYKTFYSIENGKGKGVRVHSVKTALDKYAPKFYSRENEELIIRHFFNDRQGGFFLDVGAFHFMNKSNTYYLEKYLDWTGIALDANKKFEQGYIDHRPNTRFYNFFVSDRSDDEVDFFVVKDPRHVSKSTAIKSAVVNREVEKIKVPTVTLNDLLDKTGVKKIDFLTIDIELWEPKALAGLDIKRFRPDLVCIESHKKVRKQILHYFIENGYVRLDQYLLFDPNNWYFAPKHDNVEAGTEDGRTTHSGSEDMEFESMRTHQLSQLFTLSFFFAPLDKSKQF